MLWQDDARARARTERPIATFPDAIESVTRRHHPGIGRWTPQVFAEVFEDRRVLGWQRGKIVDRFVDAGGEAGCGYVVSKDAAVHDLREKSGPGEQLPH